MPTHLSVRQAGLRSLVAGFLEERLQAKLDKLAPDDPKRTELRQQYRPAAWLADAARRVGQIQAVTHSLKPVHPDAKGTSLYSPPPSLPVRNEVGSHCLGDDFEGDVVGNAAALDVYKLLKLSHEDRSLLDLALQRDADLAAALSDDATEAAAWIDAYAGLVTPRGRTASHTLAKQVYWPVGDDLHDDAGFHLLAPLYATSLAHRVHRTIQDDRFGEDAKAARQARRDGAFHDRPVREYPQLAMQKLGGTKPQNISQLNSERRGENHLLASLPPIWRSSGLKPLHHAESMFPRYGRRQEVKLTVKTLRTFLETDPSDNKAARNRSRDLVERLIDEFLLFTAELRTLDSGWSGDAACRLGEAERHWLDPEGAAAACAEAGEPVPDDDDIADRIGTAFARWLNGQLRDPLPMENEEFVEWRRRMREAIAAEARGDRDDD